MAKPDDTRTASRTFAWRHASNRWVLPLVFFAILLTPILWFGHPGPAPAQLTENRKLRPFPASYSLFWFQKVEQWFEDHFGMRNTLVYLGARIQVAWLGISFDRRVAIGPDGWLFFDETYTPGAVQFADFLGRAPFGNDQLQRMADNLATVHRALKACGIAFYFVMPPDKQTIYPEKLPFRKRHAAPTRADQLFAYLRSTSSGVPALDLRAPILAAKVQLPHELYLRTDTHWNDLGAFVGYREIALRLAADGVLPASPRTRLDFHTIASIPFEGGDIAVSMLSVPNYFPDYNLQLQGATPRRATFLEFPDGWPKSSRWHEYVSYDNPEGRGNLLLYRDSFSHALLPFLAEDFRQVTAIWRSQIDGREIRQSGANLVVLQVLERELPALEYNSPQNLEAVCAR